LVLSLLSLHPSQSNAAENSSQAAVYVNFEEPKIKLLFNVVSKIGLNKARFDS